MKSIKVSHDMPKLEGPMNWPVTLSVTSKQIPEIKDWQVGKKYKMMIEVEQKSMSESEDMRSASFEIVSYGLPGRKDSSGSNPGKHKRYV